MRSGHVKKYTVIFVKTVMIGVIFYYLLSGIEWDSFLTALRRYGSFLLAIGIVLIIINDIIQGWRWRFLSRGRCSLQASFESIVVGGFLNVMLPAKLGEISRLIYLRNFYDYPISQGIGVMVIERGADLFMVAFFLAVGGGVATGNIVLQIGAALFIIAMIGIVFLLKKGEQNVKLWLRKIPLKLVRVYSQKIVRLILRDLGLVRTLQVVGYTLILRLFYFLTVSFFLNGVASLNLSWGELLIVYLVSSIAWAIPLSPGGVGTFHAGVVMSTGWYGVGKDEALAIAVVFHLLLNLVPMGIALLIIVFKDISLSGMVRMEERK